MSSLTTTEQKVLNQFVEYLNQVANNEIIKVILYGSKARGDNRPDSDMDVLILVQDKKRIDRDKIYDFIIDVELEYGIDISLNIYDNDRFNQLASIKAPFVMNVIKEGENLWTI
ncbi:MAG: nucleotidyltransferase domain-containing protein [Bacillota bacterium]|jgi:predicted nucleotidyltransferase